VVFVENVPTYHSIGHESQKAAVFCSSIQHV